MLNDELRANRLVTEKTTIPIPTIVAYAYSESSEPLSSFLILQYVEGERLSFAKLQAFTDQQRSRFYTSLADVYIQLRRFEFPSIGCLVRSPEGDFRVGKKTTSIDINMQELEGLRPSHIQASYYAADDSLTSASDYVAMLLEIADHAFVQGRSSVLEGDEVGRDALYHLHIFRRFADQWVDKRLDRGPFVLVHGDLELFNLLVNQDLEIVSVLDWEWSRVVPLQFFKPPLWLGNPDTTKLAYNFVYSDYLERFDQFQAILKCREIDRYGTDTLFGEWSLAKVDSGFLVANALENWTDIDWFAFRYINWKRYKGKTALEERVTAFIREDPAREALVARKVRDGTDYKAELVQLKELDRLGDHEDRNIESNSDRQGAVSGLLHAFLKRLSPRWLRKNCISSSVPTASKLLLGAVAIVMIGTTYTLARRTTRTFGPR